MTKQTRAVTENNMAWQMLFPREYEPETSGTPLGISLFFSPWLTRANPVYLGKISYGRLAQEKIKGTRDQFRRVKTENYMLVDGRHEAIIDEKLWQEVRMKRKETGVASTKIYNLERAHLLSGLVRCPVCGEPMIGSLTRKHKKKTGEVRDLFYYRCRHLKKIDEDRVCDFNHTFREEEIDRDVEELILDMVNHEQFRDFVLKKMDEKIDVSAQEVERDQVKKQLIQVEGSKNKLMHQLDALNVNDRHYERKYQDMQERLDNFYDRINDLEAEIAVIDEKIHAVNAEGITAKQVYQILSHFDILYQKMTDGEKKELLNSLIDRVETYPERQENGSYLKAVYFKFPVRPDDESATAENLAGSVNHDSGNEANGSAGNAAGGCSNSDSAGNSPDEGSSDALDGGAKRFVSVKDRRDGSIDVKNRHTMS